MITALIASAGLVLCVAATETDSLSTPHVQESAAARTPEEPAAPDEVRSRVVNHGQDPHRKLRYTLTEGDVFIADIVSTHKTSKSTDDAPPEVSISVTRSTVRLTVSRVDEESAQFVALWESVAQDDDPEADMAQQMMARAMTSLRGARGTYRMNSRGELLEFDVDLPRRARWPAGMMGTALVAEIASLTVGFPSDAVGTGAEWVLDDTSASSYGFEVGGQAQYRLASLGEDELHVTSLMETTMRTGRSDDKEPAGHDDRAEPDAEEAVEADPAAAPKATRHPHLPMAMLSGSTSRGEYWISLDQPVPIRASSVIESDDTTSIRLFGRLITTRTQSTMKVEITTRRAE